MHESQHGLFKAEIPVFCWRSANGRVVDVAYSLRGDMYSLRQAGQATIHVFGAALREALVAYRLDEFLERMLAGVAAKGGG